MGGQSKQRIFINSERTGHLEICISAVFSLYKCTRGCLHIYCITQLINFRIPLQCRACG